MPSTRKGGGEAPPGNTKKPNKGKRQLVRWDRKFNLNVVYLYQSLHASWSRFCDRSLVADFPQLCPLHMCDTFTSSKCKRELHMLIMMIEDLDTLLLLTIQSACNLTGVKVPWDKVAELMGPKFSEGAIVQHLSKVRLRRDAAGQRVPPPLRRSVTATAAAIGSRSRGGSKSAKASSRKRKRSDDIEEDYYDDLGTKEEEESGIEYIQDKKKYKARRSPFSNKKKSSRLDDGEELMCAGAPFLKHLGQEEYEEYYSDIEEESDDDELNEDYDSDYLANIKDKQGSPTPRPSRIVKLPVSVPRNRDCNTMKPVLGLDTATPPASFLSGSRNQSFENIDPAMMDNNTGPMFGQQGVWYPVPMPISQPTENPYQAGQSQMYWAGAPAIHGGQMLRQGEFMWPQHTPSFTPGQGGTLAVSGPPPQAWAMDQAYTGVNSTGAMDTAIWHVDHHALEQQDEHKESHVGWNQKQEDHTELD